MGDKEKISMRGFIIVLVVFIISFLISVYLFPNSIIPLSFENEENISYVAISEDYFNKPNFKNSLRHILSSPFDLDYYKIVIRDTSEVMTENNCNLYLNFVLGEKEFALSGNETIFNFMKIEERYLWNKKGLLELEQGVYEGEPCKFKPQYQAYAETYQSDIWALRIITIIAILSLFLLLNSYKNFIYKNS